MKKIILASLILVFSLVLINSLNADIKTKQISIGVHTIQTGDIFGGGGIATVGFGAGDQMRIDVGVGSLTFAQGYNSPVTIGGIFYYNFNPRSQNVMHVVADVLVTFNAGGGLQGLGQGGNTTLFTIGGGIGWECFVNRDFSVNADVVLASVTFGGGSTVFSVLMPVISAHYYL